MLDENEKFYPQQEPFSRPLIKCTDFGAVLERVNLLFEIMRKSLEFSEIFSEHQLVHFLQNPQS